ncbi:MAG: hypothetical protein GC191_00410 [Azospirillum sp.]|nr:hypothetical protein [Azospirillum sp.]
MQRALEDFCRQIDHARSADAIWVIADRFCRGLGFDWTLYGYGGHRNRSNDAFAFAGSWSSYPVEWMKHYLEQGYQDYDDGVRHCVGCGPSLAPHLTGIDLSPTDRDPRALLITAETTEFGMRSGVALPMRWHGRHRIAGFGLASRLPGPEFQKILAEHGPILRMAMTYAHTRIQVLLEVSAPFSISLTERERVCLQYAADGLLNKTIAVRLNLSAKAVAHLLDHARKKLAAANTTHAVAKAIALGAIDL